LKQFGGNKMTESQSRYSIVERLTDKKLSLMSEVHELDTDIKKTSNEIKDKHKDLIQWNKDIEEDIVRTRNVKEREIEKIEQRLKLEQERKDDKQKALELQITAIDSALADIKSISKESNEQAGGK
jgi:chromosome segregation ATPase